MNFANGDKYTGDFLDGVRAGHGKFSFANGNCYEERYLYITHQFTLNTSGRFSLLRLK